MPTPNNMFTLIRLSLASVYKTSFEICRRRHHQSYVHAVGARQVHQHTDSHGRNNSKNSEQKTCIGFHWIRKHEPQLMYKKTQTMPRLKKVSDVVKEKGQL